MMTTPDILRLVRRWWWVLVIGPILGLGVGYLVSESTTPSYRSSSIILVEEEAASGASGVNQIVEAQRRASTYARLIETSPVLQEAAQRLGINVSPAVLRREVSVGQVRDTQLLNVSVTDPSPARAAALANTIAEVFIEQRTEQERSLIGTASEALTAEIDRTRNEMNDVSSEIEEYKARPDAGTTGIQTTIRNLESQLTQLQTLYSSLLDKQVQAEISASQQNTRLLKVENAAVPTRPVSPNVRINTALGGIVGLLTAAGLVLFIGYVDNTVKTSDDVRRLTNTSALGTIPTLRSKEGLEPLQFPRSPATEAYRALRTNLQFASLGRDLKSLVVTSPRPGDGKTTTISNLATVLAQGGQRVILVDGDLRKPRAHKMFSGLVNRTGLTNLLLADARVDLEPLLQPTAIPSLRVLTTGPLPPNPSDVLNSQRMQDVVKQLEEATDVVLIDAPPMAVSDALIIASLVDGVMLVTTGGRTRSNELVSTVEALGRSGTKLTGVVINRVRSDGESYYYQSYYMGDETSPQDGGTNDPPSKRGERRRMFGSGSKHSADVRQQSNPGAGND